MTSNKDPELYWLKFDLDVALTATGLSRQQFMQAAGISAAALDDHGGNDKLISRKIWQTAEALTGRPEIGLEVTNALKLDDFGDLGLAAITSADLRAAIENLVTLSRTLTTRLRFRFFDGVSAPSVVLEETGGTDRYSHHTIDSTLMMGVFLARALLGKSQHSVLRVNFRHPDFGRGQIYRERLGCPCRFDQPMDSVQFAVESLEHPMPLRNAYLQETLLTQLQKRLAGETDLRSQVLQAVGELIAQQLKPSRHRVSELLGRGERTLLRQLEAAKLTFRELQEAALEYEARRLLIAGFSAEAIAERLGYAGGASLARMMKRRTGKTLSALRGTP